MLSAWATVPATIRRMFTASAFRDLVSGRRRGFTAAVSRSLLRAAEIPYTAAVRWRNHCFDSGRSPVHRLSVPVVSVGNLTLGGTGKTPFVEWLARWFQARNVRVALVSRGYGSAGGAPNDEARELHEKLPGVPHFQHPDRLLAGRRAIAEAGAEIIVLDDAFQHRRLARDLDIVLVDACEPFGFGHVFPRGTLREPLAGCQRADILALTRADMLALNARTAIWSELADYAPTAARLELGHAPRTLRSAGGAERPTQSLAGRRVAAFCGIGNPAGFRHVLTGSGYDLVELREFPDHHAYGPAEIRDLNHWAGGLDAAAIVCTHKDLVKLPLERLGDKPLWALTVGIDFLSGQSALEARLMPLLQRIGCTKRAAA